MHQCPRKSVITLPLEQYRTVPEAQVSQDHSEESRSHFPSQRLSKVPDQQPNPTLLQSQNAKGPH